MVDDNGGERALDGKGLLLRDDGSVYHTDGSAKEGEIKLKPESVAGGDELIVLAAGVIKALITAGNEGKILVVQGGKFTLVNPTVASTTFRPEDIPQLTEGIAALGCGSNGTLRLGQLKPGVNAFVYYDENGNLVMLPVSDSTAKIVKELCKNVELLGPAESIEHVFGCTLTGEVRKFLPFTHSIYHVRPLVAIMAQGTPGNIPPSPGPVFSPFSANFDYRTVIGYDAKFTTAMIDIHLGGYSGTRSFDIYLTIDDVEYARIRMGYHSASDSAQNQVLVPIPVSKISSFKALEYTNSPGTYGPCGVYVTLSGFMI